MLDEIALVSTTLESCSYTRVQKINVSRMRILIVLLLLSILLPQVASQVYCPASYTYVSSQNSCYLYRPSNVHWGVAQTDCANRGGHLVTINDASENTYISTTYSTAWMWTGLNDINQEVRWYTLGL